MPKPCAASSNLASNFFWNLHKLSYASITRRQPTPFLTTVHSSYQSARLPPRPDPCLRRWLHSTPTYSQSPVVESADNHSTAGAGSAAKDTPEAAGGSGEGAVAQSKQAHVEKIQERTSSSDIAEGHSPHKEKRVKPRRHRKRIDEQNPERASSAYIAGDHLPHENRTGAPRRARSTRENKPLIRRQFTPDPRGPTPIETARREHWQTQKDALKQKFEGGWNPRKKLSPDAIAGVRHLHAQDPTKFSTPVLAEQFKVSAEAIRRILKSKWRPGEEVMAQRRENWEKRHQHIWDHMAEIGLRPKKGGSSKKPGSAVLDPKPDKPS